MPFSFRKRIKIAPGVKVNLSHKGLGGFTFGGKRARVNIGKRGTSVGGSIGGGLSWSHRLGGKGRQAVRAETAAPAELQAAPPAEQAPRKPMRLVAFAVVAFVGLFALCILFGMITG